MFEGLVRQLIAGYLGRYIKDIQKEQLKIGLWNEEVLLENVELILEAFDYLQLPFALKQGCVGRLSIKIPWKKLGWDPIIIVLEDVFVCACQRDDYEWGLDSVERREFAGKKAKLAAAELAKLSRRVCDSRAGQSFISYISAKILDGIQVSIRNVHVLYTDKQNELAQFTLGLRFSSLTIMTDSQHKLNSAGSYSGKMRGCQVSKMVEILGLGIYCNAFEKASTLNEAGNVDDLRLHYGAKADCDRYDYILERFDVTVSLMVNRSGVLENGVPQYAVSAELTTLVVILNEVQLQQILLLSDYISTSALREKYGRYRPLHSPLSMKLDGWQKKWWHYAQESILSDVRKKHWKTSWSKLGQRISYRRKYVKLYRTKLDSLRQEQPVSEDVIGELEQMEKESEIDDILNYRSIAERQLQEFLLKMTSPTVPNGAETIREKQQSDERSSTRQRGWLNWLSLGMLGAGGTDDSSQFAGVVSDEVIKDIYEATKFHPVFSYEGVATVEDKFYVSSIKLSIQQINATLKSMKSFRDIIHVTCHGLSTECKLWEDSANVLLLINLVEIVDPYTMNAILVTKKDVLEESIWNSGHPFVSVQVEMSPLKHDPEFSIKVELQDFEVTYGSNVLLGLLEFHDVLGSVQFQHHRVLSSLNRFENLQVRLYLKAQYVFLNRTKVIWNVTFNNAIIKFPWQNKSSELFIMALDLGGLTFRSNPKKDTFASEREDQFANFLTPMEDVSLPFELENLYDQFKIDLINFEVNIVELGDPHAFTVFERFGVSFTIRSCSLLDESILKQLEVHCSLPSLGVHFSPSICNAFVSGYFDLFAKELEMVTQSSSENIVAEKPNSFYSYQCSIAVNLEYLNLHVNLDDDTDSSSVLAFGLEKIDMQYDHQDLVECWVSMSSLKVQEVNSCTLRGGSTSRILCSPRNVSDISSIHQHAENVKLGVPSESEKSTSAEACFLLHFKATRSSHLFYHEYKMCLDNVDLHCYPRIFGLMQRFYDRISSNVASSSSAMSMENYFQSSAKVDDQNLVSGTGLQNFGFSNYKESGSAAQASIPLDHFPFITIWSSGSLASLDRSLIVGIPEWRRKVCVEDRKPVRSKNSTVRKTPGLLNLSTMGILPSINTSRVSGISDNSSLIVIGLNLNGIKLHFHDSSCSLGTITLPVSNLSIFYHGNDCWDILGSFDGLVLSSAWFTPGNRDIWGPALPNISPVLNLRVRQRKVEALHWEIDICIGIQHVCCNLSPEFLAILIGYFSLPDWNGSEMFVSENPMNEDANANHYDFKYKFEILDSFLFSFCGSNTLNTLQLDLQQLYCSFIPEGNTVDAVKDIPHECVTPSYKGSDRIHFLNVFGRGVCLSVFFPGDEEQLLFNSDMHVRNFPLIEPLDADFWVRIPCGSYYLGGQAADVTTIMARVEVCQVIAEDYYFFCGLEEVMNVINELSKVGEESHFFSSDILHFMQLKRSVKGCSVVLHENSSETLTELRFCVKMISIKLYRSRRNQFMPSELIATADMQLDFTASLRNEIPLSLDVDISDLVLYSFYSSVILVACTSGNSISSCLDIHFSKSDRGVEILLVIPSLDIWLHLSDWIEIINLLRSFTKQHKRRSSCLIPPSQSSSSQPETPSTPEPETKSNSSSSRNFMEVSALTLKSEKFAISFHFPVSVKEESVDKLWESSALHEKPWKFSSPLLGEKTMLFEAKNSKYVTFSLHSRSSELVVNRRCMELKSNVEKIKGILEVIEHKTVSSLSFFQILQVNVAAELCENEEFLHVAADIQLESLDVRLSHQSFHFWHGIVFEVPRAAPSQTLFHKAVMNVDLRKGSLLLNDGRWSNGPILEILLRNLLITENQTECSMEASVKGDLQVNYNNIHKVMWEPFIEPWSFQLEVDRKSAIPNTSVVTDVHLKSTVPLNLNITEPLIEAIFRANEMIKDSWSHSGLHDHPEKQGMVGSQVADDVYTRRYAPYILQNETSVPLSFWVSGGPTSADDIEIPAMRRGSTVQPGSSFPIYIDEKPKELFHRGLAHSSERLNEKKSSGMAHHMISVQLDGTSRPSVPMSMDLVGLSYFEVDFSKTSDTTELEKDDDASRYSRKIEGHRADRKHGFVIPVVFEVSIQRYSKLIRLYSTVILFNATSMALELRFDIPFGVSPKVLDPIYPGEEFPLPVHLAEAGRMRWRPLGGNYLWSEAHPLSNILLQENRPGFLRSFVCYPSHPSSDPFRCCISIQDISLPSSSCARGSSLRQQDKANLFNQRSQDKLEKRFIRQVKLTTPLLVKNHLPKALSLTLESGGVTRSLYLSEVETAFMFHIDSTHDLGITFHMNGVRPTLSKFPGAEIFTAMAKLSESKFSSSETLTFYPDESIGSLCVTVEKIMDAFCGARELHISVPFLLYNCTGLSLSILDCGNEKEGNPFTIPSCYYVVGKEQFLASKHGLQFLSLKQSATPSDDNSINLISEGHIISLRESVNLHSYGFIRRHFPFIAASGHFLQSFSNHVQDVREGSFLSGGNSNSQLNLSQNVGNGSDHDSGKRRKAMPYMYAPPCSYPPSELMVKLSVGLPDCVTGNSQSLVWSKPFFLAPSTGSTTVFIPEPGTTGAFIISVSSTPVAGALIARTRAITFQPRYVISNACSKEVFCKQKGTNFFYRLGVGQHSHLHWPDTRRELLVSIRFNEPGWKWSGSFRPDHLGDSQVKMQNYVSGELNMVRIEVQNAGVSSRDEKIVGSSNGNSGTYLILLSDDNNGFMPYRINNWSMETLRIYQQKCETSEITVHPYTSCPYAWDEPCYTHRLVIEVPGERIIGYYNLDDVREYSPVYLPPTSEKPERRLFLSVRAERAIKMLTIYPSYNIPTDMKEPGFPGLGGKKKSDQNEMHVDFTERITIHMSFIGISLISSSPEELVFACFKDTRIDLLQSSDLQKLFFQISSLEIDNQLRSTPYPVILSFDHEHRRKSLVPVKNKEDKSKTMDDNTSGLDFESKYEPVFCLDTTKWRNKESSLVSFKHINIWLAPLRIELEELLLLSLFDFVRTVSLRLQKRTMQHPHSELQTLDGGFGAGKKFFPHVPDYKSVKTISSVQLDSLRVSQFLQNNGSCPSLPLVIPIGAPWQQIFLLARKQKKIYIELFDLAPIKLTVSFSSTPWMLRNNSHAATESLVLVGSTAVQRGLMALADIEGAPVYLRQLTIAHHMASWESIQEIIIRHYTRQLLHEMYKIFGSAGVIGNPVGFARNVGLGIKDFLSVPARGILQSPAELFTGMAHGTKSLFSNTIYAISNAATQFSKTAHKGVVAFTFDEQAAAKIEQQGALHSQSKGVLNEFLEGLTGLLQSPVEGAEKHGLPGVLSGIALGTAGLVARPVASILEVTGKTARSIRNRSSLHQPNRFRIRLPRPLARELPLLPYSWEEAIGISMLLEADNSMLKDEVYVMCKALKQAGEFLIITERLVLVFRCSSLVGFGSPDFQGVADPEWVIEVVMSLEGIILVDREGEVVNIVGSSTEPLPQQNRQRRSNPRTRRWGPPTSIAFSQTIVELPNQEEAEDVLQTLWSTIEHGKQEHWGVHILHRRNLR